MAPILARQQCGERCAGHGRAGGQLVLEQPGEDVRVGRRALARLVAAASAEHRTADEHPGGAEELPAAEAHHQTVESRFSISSTGRV